MSSYCSARIVGAALFTSFVLGCSNGSQTSTAPSSPTPTPSPQVTDVYLAGFIKSGMEAVSISTVWKNGVAITLGDGLHDSGACCVALSGADLYAGGVQNDGTHDRAVIWKNGVVTTLTDGTQDANVAAIAVSGTDLYAVGWEQVLHGTNLDVEARLWKNGVVTDLPDKEIGSQAKAMTISGNDVYVTGRVFDNQTTSSGQTLSGDFVALWKNGVLSFPVGETTFGEGEAIAVVGSDIYLAGEASLDSNSAVHQAVFWKNGTVTQLSTNEGQVYAMAVSGQDVYVAGAVNSTDGLTVRASTWKNGMATDYSGTAELSFATGLEVVGGDLYVSGLLYPSAVVWKNGVPTLVGLTTSSSITNASGLLVVQH